MKLGRNESCHCGSGLKFKKCCGVKKNTEEKPIQLSIPSLLGVVKFGLENMDILPGGAKSIRVKDIKLANGGDTILCEFYSDYIHALDIKGEMASIMGYFSGLFKGDLYRDINISYFGAKAFDNSGSELLYAISQRKAAEAISSGNSIEWLRTTWFQENTPDYRLARAKTIISDIENALRDVINDLYKNKFGSAWWDLALNKTIGDPVKRTYLNQFGISISDGDILIKYTFTLDLKKIISADWGVFKHLFDKKTAFEDAMVELNIIRREEAHNRDISEKHLIDLEQIYNLLLSRISQQYSNLVLNYLVENWRSKIKSIMMYELKPVFTMEEFNGLTSLEKKRLLILEDCNAQIDYLDGVTLKLESLMPPLSKKQKHQLLTDLLSEYKNLIKLKLEYTMKMEFDNLHELFLAIETQQNKMDAFSKQLLLEES